MGINYESFTSYHRLCNNIGRPCSVPSQRMVIFRLISQDSLIMKTFTAEQFNKKPAQVYREALEDDVAIKHDRYPNKTFLLKAVDSVVSDYVRTMSHSTRDKNEAIRVFDLNEVPDHAYIVTSANIDDFNITFSAFWYEDPALLEGNIEFIRFLNNLPSTNIEKFSDFRDHPSE